MDEVRREMNRFWEQTDREALHLKDSHLALDRLLALYRGLDSNERVLADQVLAEWVLSPEEAKRFDAVALIREFDVRSAEPALRELLSRLRLSGDPGAPFEREKVEGLLNELGGSDGGRTQQ